MLVKYLDTKTTFRTSLENKAISRICGIFQKRRGVRSGLPDVQVLYRGKLIFIELLSRRGVARFSRAGRLGQKSLVTNAMEALWQDVAEETADELTCCEGHDFVAGSAVGTIIFVVEGDAVPP